MIKTIPKKSPGPGPSGERNRKRQGLAKYTGPAEFYVAVTRKLEVPLPVEKAEEVAGQFMVLPLVEISSSHILKAIRKSINLQFSFRDALTIEAAVSGGASILYTEDLQHGQIIDNVKILNPFRP